MSAEVSIFTIPATISREEPRERRAVEVPGTDCREGSTDNEDWLISIDRQHTNPFAHLDHSHMLLRMMIRDGTECREDPTLQAVQL